MLIGLILLLLLGLTPAAAVSQTYESGLQALKAGDPDDAADTWLLAARQGDPRAQYGLARLYFGGEGVPQHYQKALYWFEKASETGHGPAHMYIGLMHERGLGVRRNLLAAAEWYKKSIEWSRVTEAHYRLGRLYLHGLGTPDNISLAFDLLETAAHKGHRLAQFHMGAIFDQGWGVDQNYVEAFKWYILAKRAGGILLDGDKEFNVDRALEVLQSRMTPLQLALAERRINDWERTQGQP